MSPLRELASVFLRLGAVSFGGPAAHIAMMREEIVRRRGWLTQGEFLDLLGATNLLPGPNSTEMAMHVGHVRGGLAGLLVAGTSFILPAALVVAAAAYAYERYAMLPGVDGAFYGIKPVVIALVGHALWALGRTAFRTLPLALIGAGAAAAVAAGVHELMVLAAAGAAAAAAQGGKRASAGGGIALMLHALPAAAAGGTVPFGMGLLFLVFLKTGAVLFGSGYVLLAFLRADLVERLGWLTEKQLLDAIAVGQVTPGPVFTAATFIGYILGGVSGAAVATVAIFLPAFAFVAASGPLVAHIRRSPAAGAVLDGVNAGSLALMGYVLWQLAGDALVDRYTWLIAAASLLVLVRFRLNPFWLTATGAILGVMRT